MNRKTNIVFVFAAAVPSFGFGIFFAKLHKAGHSLNTSPIMKEVRGLSLCL